jgi:hypothetical protein
MIDAVISDGTNVYLSRPHSYGENKDWATLRAHVRRRRPNCGPLGLSAAERTSTRRSRRERVGPG